MLEQKSKETLAYEEKFRQYKRIYNRYRRIIKTASYEEVDSIMEKINEELRGYGVESIPMEDYYLNSYYMNIIGLYVNMGDTYDLTLIYNTVDNRLTLWNWGDYLQQMEHKLGKEIEDL
jgi:hypothetical protein